MEYDFYSRQRNAKLNHRQQSMSRMPASLNTEQVSPIQALMGCETFEQMIGSEKLPNDQTLKDIHLQLKKYEELQSSDDLKARLEWLREIELHLYHWYKCHPFVRKSSGGYTAHAHIIPILNLLEDLRVEHQHVIGMLIERGGDLWIPGIEKMDSTRQSNLQATWKRLVRGTGRLSVCDVTMPGFFSDTHHPTFKAYVFSMLAKIMSSPTGRVLIRNLMDGGELHTTKISVDKAPRDKQTVPRVFTEYKALETSSPYFHGGVARDVKVRTDREILFPEVYTDNKFLRHSTTWDYKPSGLKARRIPEDKFQTPKATGDGQEMQSMAGATAHEVHIDPVKSLTDTLGRAEFMPKTKGERSSDWVELDSGGMNYMETVSNLELSPAFLQLFRYLVDVHRRQYGYHHVGKSVRPELYQTDPELKRWKSKEMHEMVEWENRFRAEYKMPLVKWNMFLHVGDVLKSTKFSE
ncbi:hypothetical protein HNQ88_004094 [Aureibacter tunicatorum]|uniref:Uncharacterized protein n=1 Tax=Aureibacter tunicatorum TaxID=866807 RepID=A0AAE4BUQ5_9BACT|nr:hypothetical protein [Aureibacter tunicatorum]BDD03796.1 hypothetical protein AUTU_12790 [Aureibacter tunicatorum]